MQKLPKAGIGVFAIDITNNKILIGKRRDVGLYAQPGGWLEYGETWEECGARELKEETGISVDPSRMKHIKTFNCFEKETNYHNVAVYLLCELNSEEIKQLKNVEQDKCEEWNWVDFEFLRENIDKVFFPIKVFLLKESNVITIDDLLRLI